MPTWCMLAAALMCRDDVMWLYGSEAAANGLRSWRDMPGKPGVAREAAGGW